MNVTKQALSRGVASTLRMTGLPPALGLKSTGARRTYQKSNGRHDGDESPAAEEGISA